jgi:hypothetical protein
MIVATANKSGLKLEINEFILLARSEQATA